MSVKINKLEIENVKRVKAVKIEPTQNGLTIVGGNNNQGKTSVLDAIAWALGGNKYKPSQATREGSVIPPQLHIVMNNGLVIERKGKNSDLKVIDPNGQKGGQQLLNSFVEELAIDLPKFMESSNKEKANTLLQIIGVGPQLYELEREEQELYNKRHTIGQIKDQKEKFAKEMQYYPEAPKELVSISELVQQQQTILAKNGENQRKRQEINRISQQFEIERQQIENLRQQLMALEEKHDQTAADLEIAQKSALNLQDESTEELEKNIAEIDEINRKVRVNLDKDKAEDGAKEYKIQYDHLSAQIEEVRDKKAALLNNANLPLPGLTVDEGELIYNGQKWDNMSGSEQLKVSTAIIRKLKPDCGFILLDKLEQMDMKTLEEFGQWLEQEGLQAIATRVSTGDECSIIIEDGYVVENKLQPAIPEGGPKPQQTTWKEGTF
ncbi:chromosome segregation protein SMC [Enterococcus faecium]|uniref:AAA family ATPase n=1 Tax=Enterococcus faecium TaxID=1352 RepID=UPI000CF2C4F7|nr:AAA family ATPase [Enterococcus faecium]EGP5431994.1 chromosome segregation protein SMC [Enterococcus faecium]EME8212354.1 AAA family ATPase [Enterococcus faecium]PQB90055.1 chromosome segregation protein SMC [Enterococcus faecium]PQB93901.1 chromosome segregation protein SMC [Enterococcus faecium]PQC02030.1 chromosome segregation protein SMC [Enterococcus faecium]